MANTEVGNLPQVQADAVEASIEQAHAAALSALPRPNLSQPLNTDGGAA